MSHSLLEFAFHLTQKGQPFVLATVVRCERPTSAKPGSQAIIQHDGQVIGWVGGSCTQPVVVREATRLLREGGDPFLLRLGAPGTGAGENNAGSIRTFPMMCASGGVLDIYIEPHLPQPQLLLFGPSPVVSALKDLAGVLDFTINQLDQPDLSQVEIDERTSIVVATHGLYDEDVLEQVLTSSAAYIGMVSSSKRAHACRDYLRASGMEESALARLKAPAGLNIGAVTPEEIAASILAELVQVRRRAMRVHAEDSDEAVSEDIPDSAKETIPPGASSSPATAIDPVCGMMVEIASARHKSSYQGREFYFCCPACKREFEREPQHYLVVNER